MIQSIVKWAISMRRFARLLALALIAPGILLTSVVKADDSFSWINSPLAFQKGPDTSAIPSTFGLNIDCQKQSASICSVPTIYGAASGGFARLNSDPAFSPVMSYLENRQRFLPVPNSSTFITYTTEPPYGTYMYFNYNFTSSVKKVSSFGAEQYKVTKAPDGKLADKSGKRLAADYASMNFSQNGQWMIVSSPNIATLRVNMQTFEVLPFGNGFNYAIGIDPAVRTAITNDGRYAVVGSQGFNSLKFYDLSTCGPVPSNINGPVSCPSRDLKTFLSQQLPGFKFNAYLKFINNEALIAYSVYSLGALNKTALITIGASGLPNRIELLGMGESYISGEGAFNYQGGTDVKNNTCHLSLISYPYLIGRDLKNNSYQSVACSGSIINDITDISGLYTGQADNKLIKRKDRSKLELDSIFASFKPGYINQSDFVSRYRPKTILISIGGNDIGFSKILIKCIAFWNPGTCYDSYEDRVELVRQINNELFPDLVETYQTLKGSGAPDTRIYVVGYPQLAKAGGNCGVNVQLDSEEILFSKQLISYLNSVIKLAATKAGVFYVDAEDALNGHLLCEAEPGSVAINGITAGHDRPFSFGPIGAETYHPNDLGHQLLENKVLAETSNLTTPMPAANLNIVPPVENGLEFLKAPKSGRPISIIHYNNGLSEDSLTTQTPSQLNVDGARYALKPNASYTIELHSTPFSLGTFNTDANGNFNAQISLPPDVPDGVHTLHVLGSNINSEAIDVYKFVYVANSQDVLGGDDSNPGDDNVSSEEPVKQQLAEDASSTDSIAVTTNDSSTQTNNGASEQLQPANPLSNVTSTSSSPPVQVVNPEIQTTTLAVQSSDTTPKIVSITPSPPATQIISPSSEKVVYVESASAESLFTNQEQKQATVPVVLGEKTESQIPQKNSSNKSALFVAGLITSLLGMSLATKYKTRNR